MKNARHRSRRGILLMEVLIGVMIFATGVVMLGKCVTECMRAEALRMEERDIRNALESAMAEVLATPTLPDDRKETELEGTDPLITIVQSRKPLPLLNEQKVQIPGIYEIILTAKWETQSGPQEQSLRFVISREQ